MTSIASHIITALESRPDQPILAGGRLSVAESWRAGDLARAARRLAAGLARAGLAPDDRIGLVADNHDRWILADLGALAAGLVDVPRGADCSAEEAAFVIEHSGARALMIQDAALLESFWPALSRVAGLELIIVMRPGEPAIDPGGRRLLVLDDLLGEDELLVDRADEALATIVYTSGTTGNPKGVRLRHGNILHNVRVLPDMVGLGPGDRYLSFLPTWHSFERTLEYCLLAAGSAIHYSDKARLRHDMPRVRPTIMAGVPRLWESLVASVLGKIERSSGPSRLIARALLAGSRRRCAARRQLMGLVPDATGRLPRARGPGALLERLAALACAPLHALADRQVYARLREAMGGALRLVISGGGALPGHVDEFFDRAGLLLLNGYGLTETAPVVSLRDPKRNVLTTSGRRLAETSWRVMDEDGKKELERGRKGVLWIRGPQVMEGYHQNPEATARVLRDGWFCSGDLAILTEEDDLIICGRAKDTIVLRGGENVEPELVEAALVELALVQDLVVVGHGEKHLAALVVPDLESLRARLPELGPLDAPAAARDPRVGRLLHEEIRRRLAPARGWRIYEQVPRIALLPQGFSTEDGTLTLTLKKRRSVIEDRHADRIRALFVEGADEVQLWPGEGN
ncbi:MAG: AMP-binding protein [Planctomycetes bacterium]|nr:AMP-binding protein [Planctomycetota bacterium]